MAIESKIKDGIGLIGLNRPEKANAYDKAHLTMI
jgi:enoyl-CoA hydratase/carnithine racemase